MRYTQSLVSLVMLCGAVSLKGQVPTNAKVESRPQIVRVSYVQGEVKVSTGIDGRLDLGKDWVAAGVNFPIEKGATLATEKGRAEVEFENGSVAYLAENSVLEFVKLKSRPTGTSAEVALLTGRATFALESSLLDAITIDTPGAAFHMKAGMTLRVESAVDGAVFKVVDGSIAIFEGTPPKVAAVGPGEAVQSIGGVLTRLKGPEDDADQKAWDQWVSEERTARKADIERGLKESGLAAPIPGLVDLVRGGTFTDCAPYGRCWEPNEAMAPGGEPGEAEANADGLGQNAAGAGAANSNPTQDAGVRYKRVTEDRGTAAYVSSFGGPCSMGAVTQEHYYVVKTLKITPQNPQGEVVKEAWGSTSTTIPDWWQYPWATCFAGRWVASTRIHRPHCGEGKHKCPPPKKWVVRPKSKSGSFLRVRIGKGVGFIPKHPMDIKGHRPLNAKDGVLVLERKGGQEVAVMKAAPKVLQIEQNLPAGYEGKWARSVPKVAQPVIEGRLLKGGPSPLSAKAPQAGTQKRQTVITYDYKTGNFVGRTTGAGSARGNERPEVMAHVNLGRGNGNGSYAGNGGGRSGSGGGSYGNTRGGGEGSRGSSGGGSSARSSSGGGGGGSHASSSGGGGGGSHASSGGSGGGGGGGGGGGHPH